MQYYLHAQSLGKIDHFSGALSNGAAASREVFALDPASSLPRGPYNQELLPLYGGDIHQHQPQAPSSPPLYGGFHETVTGSNGVQSMSDWNNQLISNGSNNMSTVHSYLTPNASLVVQEPVRATCVGPTFQPITAPNAPYATSLRPIDNDLLSPSSAAIRPLGADSYPCGMGNGVGQTQPLTSEEIQARNESSHSYAVQHYMRSLDDERNPANDFIPFTRQWSS